MKTKQNYERPHMRVVELRGRQRILAGSDKAGVQNYTTHDYYEE